MSKLGVWSILKSPVVTEKSVILKEDSSEDNADRNAGQVLTFRVDTKATKTDIKGAVEEAKKQGKQILVDMIAVKNLAERAAQVDSFGVDYVCVHTGYDLQAEGQNSFEDLRTIKSVVKNAKVAVAGGIKLSTLPEVIAVGPDLIIVGGGITGQADIQAAASEMQQLIKQG